MNTKETLPLTKRSKRIQPSLPQAQREWLLSLFSNGQIRETLNAIVALTKDYPEESLLYNISGICHRRLGQLNVAIKDFEQALKIRPNFAQAHNNLGLTHHDLGHLNTAINCYDKAHAINPDYAIAHNNLGMTRHALGQLNHAVKSYEKALAIKPDYAEAQSNLGLTHHNLDQFDAAVKCHKKALAINPDYAQAYYNLGITLTELNQPDTAVKNYEKALAIKPNYVKAKLNLSTLQLNNGFLSEGFKNYEVRWLCDDFPSRRRKFSIPRWAGEPLTGKNILIWEEQGIGDEVMFSSIIPEFEKLNCNVSIECSAKLVAILHRSFPWAKVREPGDLNCEESVIYSQFDYQIPMGSLAPMFRKTLDDFSTQQKPFIPRFKEAEQRIRNESNLHEGQLLIGLSWRSSNQSNRRSVHYLTAEDLVPLKTIKNAVFLGIQYDHCLPELERVRELGLPIRYFKNIDQKNDLASACTLIGACDLVVSASTSVFQMSGALGVPTIMFDAFKSRKKRIPWHPTVRHFPLNSNEPSLLINNIINQMPELIAWANGVTTSERQMIRANAVESGRLTKRKRSLNRRFQ